MPQETPEIVRTVFRRLKRDGRWDEIEPTKDAMIRECRSKGMSRSEAQTWVYSELDRLYPPLPGLEPQVETETEQPREAEPRADGGNAAGGDSSEPAAASTPGEPPPRACVRDGLGGIPAGWPYLPPNASLQQEIAWVQAERLRIVAELPSGQIKVNLDQARSPAPSWSALSWLETSIRSYAKYVEVAAKATATAQDEQDQVRRERLDLAEVRSLLEEMRNS